MRALKWIAASVVVLFVLLALFVAFGLNALRGPIERKLSERTGRELRIGSLHAVWSWANPRFRAEKVTFANPAWATTKTMLTADAIEAEVELLPLFYGQVVLPDVHLVHPRLDLELAADGRKNWILERDQKPKRHRGSRFHIQAMTLDEGVLRYEDATRDIAIEAHLGADRQGTTAWAYGIYRGVAASAAATGGPVLRLRDTAQPYALHFAGLFGDTHVEFDGTIVNLLQLTSVDVAVELSGSTLARLYDVIGVAFPHTNAYTSHGRLVRNDHLVRYQDFVAKVGDSDLAGTLQVDTDGGRPRPFMHGEVTAKVLKLADLGPIVGTGRPQKKGVLPDMPFDPGRWGSIDADVSINAGTLVRPKQLPLENLATRVNMRDRVLSLDPLAFGIAGGKLAGTVKLDGSKQPIAARIDMRVKDLSLPKLFPTVDKAQTSIGDVNGLIELAGRGDSVAQMLGTADGKLGVFIDGGRVSKFLMQLAALDLWGVAKTKLQGDEPVPIRCAIGDFAVKNGVMHTNALVFDTNVVNVQGSGEVNLKSEAMDLKLKPQPKDSSVASLNSPLYIRGTFGEPKVSPDVGKLAAKGLGAVLMGVINPLLAVLPLLKEGKDKDSPCAKLIAQAKKPAQTAQKPGKAAAGKSSSSSGRSAASGAR
ncbi:MAG TPA: AsmA family protein [Burkholderiales bacterium]|nr:AsmA family protein [Burkholderiales bacterium]